MQHVANVKMTYAKYWGKYQTHSLHELRNRIVMANLLLEVYEADTRTIYILNIMKGIQSNVLYYVWYHLYKGHL